MLDLLLRWVTGRNLVIALLMAASLPFAVRYGLVARQAYLRQKYPPVVDRTKDAGDIKALLDRREAEKVEAQYRRVMATLAQAKAMGYPSVPLEWKASQAMALNIPGRREEAMRILSDIEMVAPHPKTPVPLMAPEPDNMMHEDEPPPAQAAAAGKTKKAPAKKKAKKKSRRGA